MYLLLKIYLCIICHVSLSKIMPKANYVDSNDIEKSAYNTATDKLVRPRRETQSLQILQKMFKKPGLQGKIMLTMRKAEHLNFDIHSIISSDEQVLSAQLKIYKLRPRRGNLIRLRRWKTGIPFSRVRIHQTKETNSFLPSEKHLHTKVVFAAAYGWMKFDVTETVKAWSQHSDTNNGLDVWVESYEPGKRAARVARMVQFVQQHSRRNPRRRPRLVVRCVKLTQVNDRLRNTSRLRSKKIVL